MKVYSDDPLIHYKTSTISRERTKMEIDGLLASWGCIDVGWRQNWDGNDIFVFFQLDEKVDGVPVHSSAKVPCPIIWDHEKPRSRPPVLEKVNWIISMREMFYYLKAAIEWSYISQSSKAAAVLPYLVSSTGEQLRDIIIPRLAHIEDMKALPAAGDEKKIHDRVINITPGQRQGDQ